MLYQKKKDNFKRLKYSRLELKKTLWKFLFINLRSKLNDFNVFNKKFLGSNKILKTSKTKIKRRCILTNRSKGVSRLYSISRIKLREYLQLGIFPGYKKAVW